jgi:hypothetical protein
MPINFSNGATLTEVGGRISTPGHIIQTVHSTTTSGVATTSGSAVDLFTSSTITLTSASNRILVEWYAENRANDWGDGVWNLYYMDIVHVQSGTSFAYTGYRGEFTNSIRHYHKTYIHTPGSIGPHSYKIRGWCYTAGKQTTFINGAGGDTVAHIRMSEIAA